MIRAYKNFDSFRGDSKITSWLYRILRNVFLDLKKKDKRRESKLTYFNDVNEEQVIEIPDSSLDPHECVVATEEMDFYRAVLTKLPAQYQRIAKMLMEDKEYCEIAEILNIPIGTVKSRINRMKALAQEILKSMKTKKGIRPDYEPPAWFSIKPVLRQVHILQTAADFCDFEGRDEIEGCFKRLLGFARSLTHVVSRKAFWDMVELNLRQAKFEECARRKFLK